MYLFIVCLLLFCGRVMFMLYSFGLWVGVCQYLCVYFYFAWLWRACVLLIYGGAQCVVFVTVQHPFYLLSFCVLLCEMLPKVL